MSRCSCGCRCRSRVLVVRAVGEEAVRLGEAMGVPVPRGRDEPQGGALGEGGAADLDVVERGALGQQLYGRFEPQQLLHQRVDHLGVLAQLLEGVGVAQQGEHPIGDQVDGGLMAGDQQQRQIAEHLGQGHRILVGPALGGQAGDHVVPGRAAALLDQTGEIGGELVPGVPDGLPVGLLLLGRAGGRLEGGGHGVGPAVEALLVLRGDAEQTADHGHGEGVGEVLDQVDPVPPLEAVDEAGDDSGDLAAQVVDPPGGVRRAVRPHDQPAQPVVVGRVEPDEARRQLGVVGAGEGSRPGGEMADVGADPGVVEQAVDLPVGADQVGAGLVPHHGGPAELGVQRVRVGAVGVVEDLAQECDRRHGDAPSGCGAGGVRVGRGRGGVGGVRVRRGPRPRGWCPCQAGVNVTRWSVGEWPLTVTSGPWVGTEGSGNPAGTGRMPSVRRSTVVNGSGKGAACSICRW